MPPPSDITHNIVSQRLAPVIFGQSTVISWLIWNNQKHWVLTHLQGRVRVQALRLDLT